MQESFGALMDTFRLRAGSSRNALAKAVGVDASYITRIAHGDRNAPGLPIVESVARVLKLSRPERDRLLVSAGYSPASVMQYGAWDSSLQAVVDVLNDPGISDAERDEFRAVVRMLAQRWSKAVSAPSVPLTVV